MTELCPLGYECEAPENCTQFGVGIDESDVTVAKELGLHIRTHSNMSFVGLCTGPLEYGENQTTQNAIDFLPERLANGGLEQLARDTVAITGSLRYMHSRDRINEAVTKRGE
jgi:hypothetical protein